jgi:hypothetical protein
VSLPSGAAGNVEQARSPCVAEATAKAGELLDSLVRHEAVSSCPSGSEERIGQNECG